MSRVIIGLGPGLSPGLGRDFYGLPTLLYLENNF